jgi:hypothetical protein
VKENRGNYWFTWTATARILQKSKPTISRLVRLGLLSTNGKSRKKLRISGLSILKFFQQQQRENKAKKSITPFIRRLMRGTPKENAALIESRKGALVRTYAQFRMLLEGYLDNEEQQQKRILTKLDKAQAAVLVVLGKLHKKYVSK